MVLFLEMRRRLDPKPRKNDNKMDSGFWILNSKPKLTNNENGKEAGHTIKEAEAQEVLLILLLVFKSCFIYHYQSFLSQLFLFNMQVKNICMVTQLMTTSYPCVLDNHPLIPCVLVIPSSRRAAHSRRISGTDTRPPSPS